MRGKAGIPSTFPSPSLLPLLQVHAARLLSGEDVVLKVQKKGVQGSLKADLDLLYANARVLQLLGAATALAVRRNAPRLPSRNTSRSRPVGVVTAELSDVVATLRSAILEERLDLRSRRSERRRARKEPAHVWTNN